MLILEAGVSMQPGPIPSERFWASLLDMLPAASRNASLRYTYRHFGVSRLPTWCGRVFQMHYQVVVTYLCRTWIHPCREYLCRISLRRLSLRNAARVRCATSLISVSVCRSVWLHVGLYVYVCVCPCFRFFSGPVRTRPCPRAMRSRWSAQD